MKTTIINTITISAWFSNFYCWFVKSGLTTIATILTIIATIYAIYNYHLESKIKRQTLKNLKDEQHETIA